MKSNKIVYEWCINYTTDEVMTDVCSLKVEAETLPEAYNVAYQQYKIRGEQIISIVRLFDVPEDQPIMA